MNDPPLEAGFSRSESVAVIAMGVTAGCIPALQPILLNGLLEQHSLNTVQIGQAATVEALGMAVAMTLAALFLKPDRLRPVALCAIIGAFVANSATGATNGLTIVLLRGLNGLSSGVLLWILIGLLARSVAPGRLFAIYVTAQAGLAFALSLVLNQWIMPTFGAAGGYAVLTLADLALLAALVALPSSYAPTAAAGAPGAPPLSGLLALIGSGLFLATIMAFWVYVIPMGRRIGYPLATLASAVNAAIGVQILAGLAASVLATRIKPLWACLAGAVVASGAIGMFLTGGGGILLFAALAAFSFVWMFTPPFQMPLLIEVDPSLRSAMLIGSAQLFGVAAGPMLASQTVTNADPLPAATVALACAGLSIVLTLAASIAHRRRESRKTAAPAVR